MMINQKGWRIEEPVEYEGREEVTRFRQLLHYALSEEIITLSRGAELANISFSDLQEGVRLAV
jgi:predicted HTH domain antitoxin